MERDGPDDIRRSMLEKAKPQCGQWKDYINLMLCRKRTTYLKGAAPTDQHCGNEWKQESDHLVHHIRQYKLGLSHSKLSLS